MDLRRHVPLGQKHTKKHHVRTPSAAATAAVQRTWHLLGHGRDDTHSLQVHSSCDSDILLQKVEAQLSIFSCILINGTYELLCFLSICSTIFSIHEAERNNKCPACLLYTSPSPRD